MFNLEETIDTETGGHTVTYKEVIEHAALDNSNVVIVAGSLVERMGNPLSDIDTIVLCEQRPTLDDLRKRPTPLRLVTIGGGAFDVMTFKYAWDLEEGFGHYPVLDSYDLVNDWGTRCDVTYLTFSEVGDVIDRLNSEFERFKMSTDKGFLEIHEKEFKLLHRLVTGKVFNENSQFNTLLSCINKEKLCYLLYIRETIQWSEFQDLIGAVLNDKIGVAVHLTRKFIWQQSLAFSHLLGSTNPGDKWMLAYFEKLGGKHTDLRQTFNMLYNSTTVESAEEMRCFVGAALDYLDELFLRSTWILDQYTDLPKCEEKRNNIKRLATESGRTDATVMRWANFAARMCSDSVIPSKQYLLASAFKDPTNTLSCKLSFSE